jgi:hypothetical protein
MCFTSKTLESFGLFKIFCVKDWKGGGAEPKVLEKTWVCNPEKPDGNLLPERPS